MLEPWPALHIKAEAARSTARPVLSWAPSFAQVVGDLAPSCSIATQCRPTGRVCTPLGKKKTSRKWTAFNFNFFFPQEYWRYCLLFGVNNEMTLMQRDLTHGIKHYGYKRVTRKRTQNKKIKWELLMKNRINTVGETAIFCNRCNHYPFILHKIQPKLIGQHMVCSITVLRTGKLKLIS